MRRRSTFVNTQRQERLAALCAAGTPSVEQLIDAFLRPLIELGTDGERGGYAYVKLLAVLTHSVDALAKRIVARRFVEAFQEVAPEMSESDAIRAYLLSLGTGIASIGIESRAGPMSRERYDRVDTEQLIRSAVAFASGGVRTLMRKS